MRAGEHIRRVMVATGVYTFTGDNPLDGELAGYAAGFSLVEDAMERLEKELFAATAPEERLGQWETLFRGRAGTGDLAGRRQGMTQALAARGGPSNMEGIRNMLAAAGVKAAVEESEGKLLITAAGYCGVTQIEAKRLLDRYLPSHMEWELAENQ